MTTKLQTGTHSLSPFWSGKRTQKGKMSRHTHRFEDWVSVIKLKWNYPGITGTMALGCDKSKQRWLKTRKWQREEGLQAARYLEVHCVQGWSGSRQHVIAQHCGGKEARKGGSFGAGFENIWRSRVMKWGAGVVAFRWLVGCKAKAQGL